MLIDEVLAVGDAAFAQKCMDVFRERRRAGRTIVLVTHDMATVQGFCDRAMLLHDGELRYLGDPEEAALRYYRLNFGGAGRPDREPAAATCPTSTCGWSTPGSRTPPASASRTSSRASRSALEAVFEARHELEAPVFGFHFLDARRRARSSASTGTLDAASPSAWPAGERVRIAGRSRTRWCPGATRPLLGLAQPQPGRPGAARACGCSISSVYGTGRAPGSVVGVPTWTSSASLERRDRAAGRAARGPRAIGAGRRLAARAATCCT